MCAKKFDQDRHRGVQCRGTLGEKRRTGRRRSDGDSDERSNEDKDGRQKLHRLLQCGGQEQKSGAGKSGGSGADAAGLGLISTAFI